MTDHDLQEERRRNDTLVLKLMEEIKATVDRTNRQLDGHIVKEEAMIGTLMTDAFPGGDPAGHKAWHDAEIRRIEARTKLFDDLRAHLLKWGLAGILGWLAYAAWTSFLHGPHK